jgi:hypothetical protein
MLGPIVENCRRGLNWNYKRCFDLTFLVRGGVIFLAQRNLQQSAAIRVWIT